jgi:hypothetical protein
LHAIHGASLTPLLIGESFRPLPGTAEQLQWIEDDDPCVVCGCLCNWVPLWASLRDE